MDPGEYYLCLNVKKLTQSIDFYLKLGFEIVEDHRAEKWMVLQHNNLLNFRGGDIADIEKKLTSRGLELSKPTEKHSDGSWSAEIRDPDDNVIFFNTYPDERATYL
jgi:predicted lactoylglutathione lyase